MAKIVRLQYDHTDPAGFVYYKPPGKSESASVLVNPTLISECFGALTPEKTQVMLIVEAKNADLAELLGQ